MLIHFPDLTGLPIAMPGATAHSTRPIPRSVPSADAPTLDPNQITVPSHIVALFERGLTKYISYTVLTNAKCRTSVALEAPPDSLALDHGVLQLTTPSLSDPHESRIQLAEWLEASARWVFLIENHLGGLNDADRRTTAALWRQCHATIRDRSDFSSRYSDYFAYEKELRVRFVAREDFDPSRWQADVWASVVDASRDRQIAAAIATSSSNAPSSRNSFRSSKDRDSSSQAQQGRPENRPSSRKEPHNGGQSQRVRDKCILCGSLEHQNRACTCVTTDFLTKHPDGFWKSATDVSVCFGYNRSIGCVKEACPFAHKCARCGSSDHTSQSHPMS
jgi:hypothetical protein